MKQRSRRQRQQGDSGMEIWRGGSPAQGGWQEFPGAEGPWGRREFGKVCGNQLGDP